MSVLHKIPDSRLKVGVGVAGGGLAIVKLKVDEPSAVNIQYVPIVVGYANPLAVTSIWWFPNGASVRFSV